ncbi:hypothetical protein VTK73DRAFT_4083 [Phialemonium thermophilum]|uniref:Ino eighty subunit 1 n=1 Tax=Phialemonium thermophilum TaxID=223376 RepID=A0ABR3WW58_9PEZI
MARSPSPSAPMSDVEPASSPVRGKSFMTNVTEDEDTKMVDATPEPSERPRGRRSQRDSLAANGASSLGKIKHLKKEDGEPLWRKDIQYDFLKAVFDNEQKVFTNSYEPETIGKQCFADLYIDTMSRSSKTSKVLRDKLLSDREAAKAMAMVCLLVNIGRMNTTLNFFPEMRAQLRTYHAIPSLQAHQDTNAYKQLQDAPRLKSILKGGAEDRPELTTLDQIKQADIPRTNPVNLLFVICQSPAKIAELHFPPGREFHDLIMRTNYSSESRARAFLWIMWFYLESDFTEEGCEENPFGPGVDYGVDVANQGIPVLEELTPEEEAKENVDTPEEIEFGFAKQRTRARIIEVDQQYMADSQNKRSARGRVHQSGDDTGPTSGILPRIRPSKHESDIDSVRSTPPPRALVGRQSGVFGSTGRRGAGGLKYQIVEGSSPAGGQQLEGIAPRKPRPPTAHQIAVERNRSQRVEYILDRGLRKIRHKARKMRKAEGALVRALHRLHKFTDPFEDSEGEDQISVNKQVLSGYNGDANKDYPFRERGLGGLCLLNSEEDDFGEEFSSYAAAFRRAHRRLTRWENYDGDEPLGVIAPIKKQKLNGATHDDEDETMEIDGSPSKEAVDPAETEDEAEAPPPRSKPRRPRPKSNGAARRRRTNGDAEKDETEDLDEVDKELLGEVAPDMDEGDDTELLAAKDDPEEEELDDVDKTLLGMDGESDSD